MAGVQTFKVQNAQTAAWLDADTPDVPFEYRELRYRKLSWDYNSSPLTDSGDRGGEHCKQWRRQDLRLGAP